MASASQPLPPGEENATQAGRAFSNELARLRERFEAIDRIDAQANELFAKLSEARAAVSLEISTAVASLERMHIEQEQRQRELMRGFLTELTAAHQRATGLAQIATELERALLGMGARVQSLDPKEDPEPEDQPAPPLRIMGPFDAEEVTPPPLSVIVVEIEGVPSVSLALALQRFIAGLPGVVSALTREFAADVVRFETRVTSLLTGPDIERHSLGGLRTIEGSGETLRFVLFDPAAIVSPS